MTDLETSYAALAAASRSAADREVLENVRQKHLRSAATWDSLAVSAQGMEVLRQNRLSKQEEMDPEEDEPLPASPSDAELT